MCVYVCQNQDVHAIGARLVELVGQGADINTRVLYDGCTPFLVACSEGHTSLVRALLAYKPVEGQGMVDMGVCDARGRNAMELAEMRHREEVEALLAPHAELITGGEKTNNE